MGKFQRPRKKHLTTKQALQKLPWAQEISMIAVANHFRLVLLTKLVFMGEIWLQHLVRRPPLNAKTTASRTQNVPPTKAPMRVLYVFKTVRPVTVKLELSITLVKHALAEPITLYGINTIAYRGPIALVGSLSPPTRPILTIENVAAAEPEHIPPAPTHSLAPVGQLALQAKR